MPYCPNCGKELPVSGMKFCPFCGASTRPSVPPQVISPLASAKPSHMKRNILLGLIVIVIALIGMAAAGHVLSPQTATVQTSGQPTTVATVTTAGVQYDVVIRYKERYLSSVSYHVANQGNGYLIVTLEIHNNIEKTFGTNPLNFYLIANNVKYTLDFATYSLPDTLQSVEALKGGTVSGSIAFQVPEKTNDYQLYYGAPFTSFNINWIHYVTSTTQAIREQLILEAYNWNGPTTLKITLRNVGSSSIDTGNADVFINGIAAGHLGGNCNSVLGVSSSCTFSITLPNGSWTPGVAYSLKIVTPSGGVFSYSMICGQSS